VGDGDAIVNRGTSGGSSYVQLYNGRAVISIRTNNGRSVLSAKVDKVPVSFYNL
jgi:beta-galactosidase